jgi:protein involved in polysaccharide export with SLBB domain
MHPFSCRVAFERAWPVLLAGLLLLVIQGPFTTIRAQSTAGSQQPQRTDTSGIVRPGDVIRLKVWREPDMSGDAVVNEAGFATLPRLGAVQVSNLSADSLQRFLVNTYSKDLRDPAIDITVLRRIRILGAVRNPNVYQVEPTMTVADALALAGGASSEGKQDQVELRRQGESSIAKLTRGMKLADTPIRSGDQLYVPEKSWLSRNTGLVLAGVGTLTSVLYFIVRR